MIGWHEPSSLNSALRSRDAEATERLAVPRADTLDEIRLQELRHGEARPELGASIAAS